MSRPKIGVLALQGDTREHLAALREAGAEAMTVRGRGGPFSSACSPLRL